jgi:AcrR family transcriptional regulator
MSVTVIRLAQVMTVTVIEYDRGMGRWEPDARGRLEKAALELYSERGFDQTTVAEIAERAGLTERTFFRHFADKREVLFGGPEILELATRLIAEAPASLDPATLVFGGLQTVAETRFEGRREDLRALRAIIRSDEGLRERDQRKRADLSAAIRAGFVSRGESATTAALLGEITVTMLYVALEEWLETDDDRTLFEVIMATLGSLQATMAAFPLAGAEAGAGAGAGALGATPGRREP